MDKHIWKAGDPRGQYLRLLPVEIAHLLECKLYFDYSSINAGPDLPGSELDQVSLIIKLERFTLFHKPDEREAIILRTVKHG